MTAIVLIINKVHFKTKLKKTARQIKTFGLATNKNTDFEIGRNLLGLSSTIVV
jgi:hypothetical protein